MIMTRLALTLIACGTALVPLLSSAPAHAQLNARSWVSSTGNNANPCCRALPCLTLDAALPNTAANGEINCVDAISFGPLSIPQSVTIDCHETFAAITSSTCGSGTAITINIPVSMTDPLRTVRLRNFSVGGSTNGTSRCAQNGIRIINAAVVSLENVVVHGFVQRGISDERTGGGRLTITNSVMRYNGGSGLIVLPSSGSTRIDVAVDNVVAEGNTYGLVFANGPKAMVSRSLMANNVSVGIDAEGTGAEVAVDNSTISNNGTGLYTSGGALLDVSNSNIAFNAVGANGAWLSFGNNRAHRNTAAGSLPMAMGAITHDVGQQ
jgi:hypothetical protein